MTELYIDDTDRPLVRVGSFDEEPYDKIGYPPDSLYAEFWWLPIIGPSSLWVARRIIRLGEAELPVSALGASMGIQGDGRNSVLRRSLQRLVQFDCARVHEGRIEVRRHFAPLPLRYKKRLLERLGDQLPA